MVETVRERIPDGAEEGASYYPVFLDVRGRTALVVGGGAVAERKAAGLARAGACGPPQTNQFKSAAPVYQNTRRLKSVPPVLPVGKKQAAKPFSSACASFFDKIAKLEIAAPARQNMPQKPRFFKKAHGFKFGSLQTRPGAVMLKAQPRTAFPPDTGQNGNM